MVWYNPFTWFQQTTSSILAEFHSVVAKLEGHAEVQAAKADFHQAKAEVAVQEAAVAATVAAQVRALVTPQTAPQTEPGDVGATRG